MQTTAELSQLSNEEIGRIGIELYRTRIRPTLTNADTGRIVAIDVATGDYEIGDDEIPVTRRLRARRPAGPKWLEKAGYMHFESFAGHREMDPLP